MSSLMRRFGAAIFLFLFAVGLLTVQASLADPVKLNEGVFFPVLLLFMVYSVVWCIAFFRSFRIPGGNCMADKNLQATP